MKSIREELSKTVVTETNPLQAYMDIVEVRNEIGKARLNLVLRKKKKVDLVQKNCSNAFFLKKIVNIYIYLLKIYEVNYYPLPQDLIDPILKIYYEDTLRMFLRIDRLQKTSLKKYWDSQKSSEENLVWIWNNKSKLDRDARNEIEKWVETSIEVLATFSDFMLECIL